MKKIFIIIFILLSSCVGSSTSGIFGTGVSIALDPRTLGTQTDIRRKKIPYKNFSKSS